MTSRSGELRLSFLWTHSAVVLVSGAMRLSSGAWTKRGPKQNIPPRWHVLPTGLDWKAADRAYRQGLEGGRRQLEQIRRGRGKKVAVDMLYKKLWDRLYGKHSTRHTRGLSERIWETVGKAA